MTKTKTDYASDFCGNLCIIKTPTRYPVAVIVGRIVVILWLLDYIIQLPLVFGGKKMITTGSPVPVNDNNTVKTVAALLLLMGMAYLSFTYNEFSILFFVFFVVGILLSILATAGIIKNF